MNRIDRLMGIVTILQSKKYVTADYIAEKFEMSVRTTYRDIKALSEIGIPVAFEPQKGYFIMQGYFFPPVSFTQQEANALILLESVAKRFGDESIQKHYTSALHKIKATLKGNQKEKVDFVHSQIRSPFPQANDDTNYSYLTDIQDCIANQTILRVRYTNSQDIESIRELEPIGLTFYGFSWHLIAWCWNRNEYRDFKVSRIKELSNTYKPFAKEKHIDLNTYIKSLNYEHRLP